MDGIQDVLEECAEVKGIQGILFRTDILGKVKKYDARLTHAPQVFQIRFKMIIFDIRRTNFFKDSGGAW